MKASTPLLFMLMLAVIAWLLLQEPPHVDTPIVPADVPQASEPQESPQSQVPPATSPLAEQLGAADGSAEQDVLLVRGLLAQFTQAVKEPYRPPLGINEDVVKALTGGNRMKLVVMSPGHPSLDDQGRLVDRWGTPYHIHARAADAIDVRSAGPDRTLFTADDVATVTPNPHSS